MQHLKRWDFRIQIAMNSVNIYIVYHASDTYDSYFYSRVCARIE